MEAVANDAMHATVQDSVISATGLEQRRSHSQDDRTDFLSLRATAQATIGGAGVCSPFARTTTFSDFGGNAESGAALGTGEVPLSPHGRGLRLTAPSPEDGEKQ